MKLTIKVYGCLCSLSRFQINGINAEQDEFGEQGDQDQINAEDYGCGDMRFVGHNATTKILEKYGISNEEYNEIVAELEDKLSFGSCGWCI